MKVSVQSAAEHFEELVSGVDNGESVEIARAGKRTLRLVSPDELPLYPAPRILGAGKALSYLPSEEELERIEREWKLGLTQGPF
jgi:antitoxin (DNA-binding transcriptional repressor) of toxin-antitoxin stability system